MVHRGQAALHEIQSLYGDFHALWSDQKLYEIVTTAEGLRVGDEVKVVEILPERSLQGAWKTGRFVRARVSHVSVVDKHPGKVVLGLIKVSQGDEVLLGRRRG